MPGPWGTFKSYLPSYLVVFTYEPHNRNEVIQRRRKFTSDPETGKLLIRGWIVEGEWADIAGGRFYTIVTPDPDAAAKDPDQSPWNLVRGPWMRNELGKVEIIPIVETQHLLEMLPSEL